MVTAALAIAFAAVGSAVGQTETVTTLDALLRQRVVAELSVAPARMTAERWRGLGSERALRGALIELARDRTLSPVQKHRAIFALSFFPSKQTTQVLWQFAYQRGALGEQRRMALHALGRADGEAVLPELALLLRDIDLDIRAGAVLGLASISSPRVKPLLENQLEQEQDLDVRLIVDRALVYVRQRHDRAEAERALILGLEPELFPESDPVHGLMER